MSEILTTNVRAFRNSMIRQSVRDRYNIIYDDLLDEDDLEDADIHNVFRFMLDVETYHALWVDQAVAQSNSLQSGDLEYIQNGSIENAEAINFTMDQIRRGNTVIISYLSQAEENHQAKYGTKLYTNDGVWVAELKWATFINYILPSAPDPQDFL